MLFLLYRIFLLFKEYCKILFFCVCSSSHFLKTELIQRFKKDSPIADQIDKKRRMIRLMIWKKGFRKVKTIPTLIFLLTKMLKQMTRRTSNEKKKATSDSQNKFRENEGFCFVAVVVTVFFVRLFQNSHLNREFENFLFFLSLL